MVPASILVPLVTSLLLGSGKRHKVKYHPETGMARLRIKAHSVKEHHGEVAHIRDYHRRAHLVLDHSRGPSLVRAHRRRTHIRRRRKR